MNQRRRDRSYRWGVAVLVVLAFLAVITGAVIRAVLLDHYHLPWWLM